MNASDEDPFPAEVERIAQRYVGTRRADDEVLEALVEAEIGYFCGDNTWYLNQLERAYRRLEALGYRGVEVKDRLERTRQAAKQEAERRLVEAARLALQTLGDVDEPAWYCPDPGVHRGLFIASEYTRLRPWAEVRALLDSPDCCHCGKAKL